MKNKNGFKRYVKLYGLVLVAYSVYVLVNVTQNDGLDANIILSLIIIPVLFTALIFLFDTIMEPFFNRLRKGKTTNVQEQYKQFFMVITNQVNTECEFSIEDFRRLRENEKFQKALQQAFNIKENGETPDLNFTLLEKKFKKNSREYEAMQVVIQEVKKMMTIDGKDYQK